MGEKEREKERKRKREYLIFELSATQSADISIYRARACLPCRFLAHTPLDPGRVA